jgi:branched-chain amino acid transport system substrate-binding protein
MAGTKVAVQSGTTSDLYAQENLGMATIVAYDDFPSVTLSVTNGEADYAMGDSPVLALSGNLMTTFSDETFGLAVREDSGELLDALNVAITAIVDSGEYDLIFGAWFEGAVVLTDDRDENTAVAYPASPSEGSTLSAVLESGSLKLCSDTAYPPFENIDEDGNAVGFDIDIANALVDEIAAFYMGNENPMFVAPMVDKVIKIGVLYDREVALTDFAPAFDYAFAEAFADLNEMSPGYDFQMVYSSTQCSNEGGQLAAQTVLDAGVVAVAGAACSGASMGANSILSAAGVPMISYASTSPTLSDAVSYPHFFRVAPSDELQGMALADLVAAQGYASTAIIAMTNDYGAGVANAFETNFNAMDGHSVCARYDFNNLEMTAGTTEEAIAAVTGASETCDSVLLATYSPSGAQMMGAMYLAGAMLPAFGPDGMAGTAALDSFSNNALTNGMMVTNPRSGTSAGDFAQRCADDAVCSGGIFTSQSYDAVMMIGMAAKMEDGSNMADHIRMVGSGNGYAGASGNHVFLDNGDVPGDGYDVCSFNNVPTYGDYFNCQHTWTVVDGLEAVEFAGMTVKIGFMGDATSPAIGELWPSFQTSATIGNNLANIIGWNSGVQFEIVFADSGCNGYETTSTGTSAAQSLVDAGVWGAVGAACSGASMAANAVLSAAGIPMISYASTSADLSDATAYPDFFRVVPSDAGQAAAVSDIMAHNGETMTAAGGVAVIAASDDYTAALADGFTAEWIAAGGEICTRSDYTRPVTDYSAVVQSTVDNACGSVALFAYNSDGAGIITELNTQAFSGQIYGTDGIASVTTADNMQDTLLDGVIATNIATAGATEVGMVLQALWPAQPPMGQFAMEAFDAYTVMAFSAFTQMSSPGITASQAISATGNGWNGATGSITFLANGDTPGNGYCVGVFSVTDAGADGEGTVSYDCTHIWGANGLTEVE